MALTADLYLAIRLLLGFLVTIFAGYNILLMVFRKNLRELYNLEQIFISFALGIAFITLELFIYSSLRLEWSLINIVLPWLVLVVVNLFLSADKKAIEKRSFEKQKLNLLEKFLICIIALEIVYVFFRASCFPLSDYDGLAIWGIKAKSFYLKGTVFTDIFTEKVFLPAHPDYPLLLPLGEAWVYKTLGEFNDYLVKALFPIYFIGTLAVFYSCLIRLFKRKAALLFTFFLATVSQFRNFGFTSYAEIVLVFYFTASFLYLFLWMKKENFSYLILSALLAFSGIWTKNEGSMLFLVNLIVLAIMLIDKKINLSKKIIYFLTYSLIVVLLFSPWIIFKSSNGLSNDVINKDTMKISVAFKNLNRILPILNEYQKHVFGPKKWNIIWILVILIFILKFKNIFKDDQKYFTYAVIFCFLGYALVYIITPQNLGWHLSTSGSRIILHFLPISLFWAALCTRKELNDF